MTQRARNRFVLARIETFDLKANNFFFFKMLFKNHTLFCEGYIYLRMFVPYIQLHWDIKCVFFTVFSAVGSARNVGQAERRDDGCQDEAHCVRVQIGECTLQFKRIPAHLCSHMSAEILLY